MALLTGRTLTFCLPAVSGVTEVLELERVLLLPTVSFDFCLWMSFLCFCEAGAGCECEVVREGGGSLPSWLVAPSCSLLLVSAEDIQSDSVCRQT